MKGAIRQRAEVVVVLSLALAGCRAEDSKESRRSASAAPSSSGGAPVVIELGPNGQTKVRGTELAGDAATCGSMKTCCAASSDVSLFCGLAQATDGATCASVLKESQHYMAERKIARPPGCP